MKNQKLNQMSLGRAVGRVVVALAVCMSLALSGAHAQTPMMPEPTNPIGGSLPPDVETQTSIWICKASSGCGIFNNTCDLDSYNYTLGLYMTQNPIAYAKCALGWSSTQGFCSNGRKYNCSRTDYWQSCLGTTPSGYRSSKIDTDWGCP